MNQIEFSTKIRQMSTFDILNEYYIYATLALAGDNGFYLDFYASADKLSMSVLKKDYCQQLNMLPHLGNYNIAGIYAAQNSDNTIYFRDKPMGVITQQGNMATVCLDSGIDRIIIRAEHECQTLRLDYFVSFLTDTRTLTMHEEEKSGGCYITPVILSTKDDYFWQWPRNKFSH